MLLRSIILCTCLFGLNIGIVYADKAASPAVKTTGIVLDLDHIRSLIQDMADVNLLYKDKFHSVLSQESLEQQTPHATMVLCSDSRVDMEMISNTPAGEIFVIRNIGNQIPTATGSVEYGVNHLHTELLVVVGHSQCGAVKAALQDYSKESPSIKAELGTLHVDPKLTLNQNLVHNVSQQVKSALQTFKDRVAKGEVVVLGMIYDLHNDFGFGNGQLLLIDINDISDPKLLAENPYVKGIKNLVILGDKG